MRATRGFLAKKIGVKLSLFSVLETGCEVWWPFESHLLLEAAPPSGYQMVRFNTRFANSADVIETVTLEREQGDWRVAGITVG